MRPRILIAVIVVAAMASVSMAAVPAWASDLGGQNNYADAQASGGQLTVQAGVTHWTPPADSTWSKQESSDPPPDDPNPNQPYGSDKSGCTP